MFIPLEQLLERIESCCARHDEWRDWAQQLRRRYTVSQPIADKPVKSRVSRRHRQTIEWMRTRGFQELVHRHEAALDGRAAIYFRPTDRGLVRIALHPAASAYIGFRAAANDNSHIFRPASAIPSIERIRSDFQSFETWMKEVSRSSDEERGVIRWLRSALEGRLYLPELGDDWVFLHQEWRFTDAEGTGVKSDILAVQLVTGQLGIVELKAESSALVRAREQVEEYGAIWRRDREELAPLFTSMLQALGAAYKNEQASVARVGLQDAALFVGVAGPNSPVFIEACG